jgi:hypothetical protein
MGSGAGLKPINDGLIFHADLANDRFYSGVGNTTYDLTGRYTGSINGSVIADPANKKSFVFDGVNDYLEFGPVQPLKYSVSVWFKPTGAPSHNDNYGGTLLGFNPEYPGNVNFVINYRWLDNTVITFHNSAGNVTTSSTVSANKVTHAVCTYDGSFIRVYIDGILNTSVSQTSDLSYPGSGNLNLQLGRWGHPGYERYFNGNIYQASVYNRALSASEILNLYNSNRKKYVPTENISTDGLILHIDPSINTCYPGTGTTIYDLSSNAYVGSILNGASYSNNRTGALLFDGANECVQFYNAILSGTQDFTIESWAYNTKTPAGQGGSDGTIFANYGVGNLQFFYSYQYIGMWLNNNSAYTPSPQAIYQYGPMQLTATRSGSNLSIYLDGNLVDTGSSADTVGTTTNFRIGANTSGTERFVGYIYNLKIYNRALPQSEIINNYNALKSRYKQELPKITSGSVFELDFADKNCYSGTGTTVYDLSSFNTAGSVVSGATFVGTGITSSFSFDGTDDYITFPYNSSQMSFPDNNATISVWFRYNSSDTTGCLITQRNSSGTGFQTYVNSSKFYADGGGTSGVLSVNNLNNGNNYNVVAVYDKANSLLRLYVNGIADNTVAYTGSIADTYTVLLGKSAFGSGQFGGNIYAAQVYNRVLSPTEISQNYNNSRARFGI